MYLSLFLTLCFDIVLEAFKYLLFDLCLISMAEDRVIRFKQAIKIGDNKYDIKESITGMYKCDMYDSDDFDEDNDTPLETSNVCAICLFMEDEPYNFGDTIAPSSYDADCDECGNDSLIYLILGV